MNNLVKIGDQTFIKTSKGWIDQKTKQPAPEGLIKILDSIAPTIEEPSGDSKPEFQSAPSLPKMGPVSDKVSEKLTIQLDRLSKVIEKLSTSITKMKSGSSNVDSDLPELLPPPKTPSLLRAMGQTIGEKIGGVRDSYDRKQTPGLLSQIGHAISPTFASLYSGARDKQRESVAQNLQYQEALKKRETLHSDSTKQRVKTGEQEELETSIPKESKYDAQEAKDDAKELTKVEVEDISDNAIKKLSEALMKSSTSESPLDKEEPEHKSSSSKGLLSAAASGLATLGGGALALGKRGLSALGKTVKGFMPEAETRLNSAGRKINAKGQFVKMTEEVAEEGGSLLKRILPSGKAFKGFAEGAGRILGSKGARAIPVFGAAIGAGVSGVDEYKKSGNLAKATFAGAGALGGGLAGEAVGATVGTAAGPAGTIAGEVAGGIGGSLAGAKGGSMLYDKMFGKKNPNIEKITPRGPSVQTQVLKQSTAKNNADSKGPTSVNPMISNISAPTTTINNVNQTSNMPTVGSRGSLDLATFI